MAEAMARETLSPHGTRVIVESAGVFGHEGSPIAPGSGAALDALGVVHAGHRGRMLTHAIVDGSDLILTMEVAHRNMIATQQPAAAGRTFTLREFARLVAGEPAPAGTEFADRARLLVTAAHLRRAQRPGIDDVPDPYGGPADGYHVCATLIRSELDIALGPLGK
ncbi:protein-tyrosine-phosphatase [Actinomadura sp. HBU206391]|nr:protein-tyrosine-phosphatase [Actinomadura sp. HBU206391]